MGAGSLVLALVPVPEGPPREVVGASPLGAAVPPRDVGFAETGDEERE